MIYPATLTSKFSFGKYKGQTVENVIDEDPAYIEWCIDEVKGFELEDQTYDYYVENLNEGFSDIDLY